ncbi:MAG: coenzyme F420-0:L-glutamate ligase [Actinomycetota bacterium]
MSELIPIETRLYTEKDDLPEFVAGYVKNVARPGDIVAVAQKLASISQQRIVYAPEMKVSFLARIICRFVNPASSQHSPEGMQAAFNEAGYFRVTVAAIVGGITRLFGRKGDFYRIAGEKVTIIDDAGDGTGTIPPYNKYVILAPEEPDTLAESIKTKTGVDTAIMDCSYVASTTLGASDGVDKNRVADLLKSNPFGNFDEMTPIVVIKNP